MTNQKVTISGIPPAWDQNEYESRVAQWVNLYHGTDQSKELVQAAFEHELLQLVIDKGKMGYTISPTKRIYRGELNYSIHMVKPEQQQAEDIEAVRIKVKNEYSDWLESEHARYQDLLREQLKQAAHEKEMKALREKEAKLLTEIEKQVQACFKPLVIPL